MLAVLALHCNQAGLPLNPEGLPNTTWHLGFNTAVSFMTNTNWQAYSGENTLSYAGLFEGETYVPEPYDSGQGFGATIVANTWLVYYQ